MPLRYWRAGFGEHFVPVFHFKGPTFTTEYNLSYFIISADPIVIHDGDNETGGSDSLVRDVEDKRLVEHGVECFLMDNSLLLLHFLAFVRQPDLHVRVCEWVNGFKKLDIIKIIIAHILC